VRARLCKLLGATRPKCEGSRRRTHGDRDTELTCWIPLVKRWSPALCMPSLDQLGPSIGSLPPQSKKRGTLASSDCMYTQLPQVVFFRVSGQWVI